ncbi:glycosyltransferase family 8 protein [Atractiella rhizophila]|nr:glycosyltransferase family 8 protein [Atractiella rhizophila]
MSDKQSVWAVLVTQESYIPGVLVLHHSLKEQKTVYPLVVHALAKLPQKARDVLQIAGIEVIDEEPVLPGGKNAHKINNLFRPRFADAYSKLKQVSWDQYARVVSLDADMLALQSIDELMTLPLEKDQIAAAPDCTCNFNKHEEFPSDWTPTNCAYAQPQPLVLTADSHRNHHIFNSGCTVYTPSKEGWEKLKDRLDNDDTVPDLIFGDQEFLRFHYRGRYVPLPWQYNALKTLSFTHPEVFNLQEVKILHYTMDKPWERRHPVDPRLENLNVIWREAYANFEKDWKKEGKGMWEYIESLIHE